MKSDQLLTTKQVADLLQVQVGTLEAWRGKQIGPDWIKLGEGIRAPIRYRQQAVAAYLKKSGKK